MIVDFLLENMMDEIREVVPEENWDTIPSLFEKVYVVPYDESKDAYIIGYWDKENPLLAFNVLTYAFIGVVMQDWVEEHGIQIV